MCPSNGIDKLSCTSLTFLKTKSILSLIKPASRPKEIPHHGKDGSARGRDPLGAHDKKKGGSGAPKYGKALALSHFDKLKKSMKFGKTDTKIITETSELEEEYHNEVTSLAKDTSND